MVNKNSSVSGIFIKGYTLVELVVVLGIVAFMGALTFYGFTNQNKDSRVISAQRELVVNLRSLQTKVDSGVDGTNFKTATFVSGSNSYTLDGKVVNLTPGVTLSFATTPVTIYFSHPSLGSLAACGASTAYFACSGPPSALVPYTSGTITLGFVGSTRTVKIEGIGMSVNRIYE